MCWDCCLMQQWIVKPWNSFSSTKYGQCYL
uniref:Uncharacterized protein n=1 Tax=Arundo donax TaxID=35708 RepID=A0A0A9AXB2_ARUDO